MQPTLDRHAPSEIPSWVPTGARHYLDHTEAGLSIRHLARVAGCHASTVLRQVRRIETLRDDPLIDAALCDLAVRHRSRNSKEMSAMTVVPDLPDGETLTHEARRILRRLCETGAVLAVSEGMDKSVVVRADTRTAVVDTAIARALALKTWIACDAPGRISRYRITAEGRAELGRMVAAVENRARGFAEAQAGFDMGGGLGGGLGCGMRMDVGGAGGAPDGLCDGVATSPRAQRVRTESPLQALSRRREKDGSPFLTPHMVAAGERLREDFELAQLGPSVAQNWDRFLVGGRGAAASGCGVPGGRGRAAQERLEAALADLGPGLADAALRCCCYLEGLEVTERRMGWSQRSGKIVLRIALQRLIRHYDSAGGAPDLIG